MLLKNDNNVLPLTHDEIKYIILVGERTIDVKGVLTQFQDFDNIGI